MTEIVKINGQDMTMRASALLPRLYRYHFGRDALADMNKLRRAYEKAQQLPPDATEEQKEDAQLDAMDLTIFENMAYLMLKQGGNPMPPTPDEWLDGIDGPFDIYQILPAVLRLWRINQGTTSTAKKK